MWFTLISSREKDIIKFLIRVLNIIDVVSIDLNLFFNVILFIDKYGILKFFMIFLCNRRCKYRLKYCFLI